MKISRKLRLNSLIVLALVVFNASAAVFLIQRMLANARQLAEVQERIDEAQMEMEINVGETARAVLHYIWTAQESDIERIDDSAQDFERFAKEFERLAENQEVVALGRKVAELYEELKALGDEIVSMSDRRNDGLLAFRKNAAKTDGLINEKLQPAIDRSGPEALTKFDAAKNMEINIDKAFAAIEGYLLKRNPELMKRVTDSEADFKRFVAQYRGTSVSAPEGESLDRIVKNFIETVAAGKEIIALTDRLHDTLESFEADLEEIDRLLDEEIQVRIMGNVARAAEDMRRSGAIAIYSVIAIGFLIFAMVSGVGWLVSRGITGATDRLSEGAAQFARGNLDHRIEARSADELGALATAFNTMADRRKQVEEEVAQKSDALEQTNVLLETQIAERELAESERKRLIEELEEKNAVLERFAYTVSHDLKSPLITIMGFAGRLKAELAAGETEHAGRRLARISGAADKMSELLESLLELSRVGRQVNPPVEVAFGDLAREAVELLSGPIAEAGAVVDIDVGAVKVQGDRIRLRETLQNLIENSLKFAGAGPQSRIEIGVRTDGDQTVFYVRDNGIGIDPAYHEKVFDLFDQLDPKSEGTGAGLALAKRIVELHGGRIWIESEGLGKGATFCLTLAPTQRT